MRVFSKRVGIGPECLLALERISAQESKNTNAVYKGQRKSQKGTQREPTDLK